MAAIFDLAESVDRQTPKIRRMLRYVRVFVSVWLLLDFFLIIVLAAIGGGNPGAAFLLFIPIIALLFAMRRISGSTVRLVLLILVIVFANLQIISIGGLLFVGVVLVALFVLGFIILELMRERPSRTPPWHRGFRPPGSWSCGRRRGTRASPPTSTNS